MNLGAWLIFVAAALLEVGGDAAMRRGLRGRSLLFVVAGAVTLAWPGITGLVLLYFIAGWAIAAGVFEIVGAIRLRKEIDGEWLLIASGLVSVLFGVLILMFPGAGALGLAFTIGIFALIYGFLLVGFSLRLRKHAEVRI